MDANDLQKLAGHLQKHGLQVAMNNTELRLHVSNPLHGMLNEEIVAVGDRYVTGFGYEIGEHRHEGSCADRIAHLLAVQSTPNAAGGSAP